MQTWFYPGNGVSLPVVVQEAHPKVATPATVALECIVRPNGHVTAVKVMSSPDSSLNRAAIRALEQWRFKPGQDGALVAVRVSVLMSFTHL